MNIPRLVLGDWSCAENIKQAFLMILVKLCFTKSAVNKWAYFSETSHNHPDYPQFLKWTLNLGQEKPMLINSANMSNLSLFSHWSRLANCKKTTRHHAHLSLCGKSRKTNNAKSRKWPKTSIWAIFWRFRGQISPNCKFFWKIGFIQIEGQI